MQTQTAIEDNSDIVGSLKWLSTAGLERWGAVVREAEALHRRQAEAEQRLTDALTDTMSTGKADFVQLTRLVADIDAAADQVQAQNVHALQAYIWRWAALTGAVPGSFVGVDACPFDFEALPVVHTARHTLRAWVLAGDEGERVSRAGLAQALLSVPAADILATKPVEYVRRLGLYG